MQEINGYLPSFVNIGGALLAAGSVREAHSQAESDAMSSHEVLVDWGATGDWWKFSFPFPLRDVVFFPGFG
jgi:hypothetical protein